MPDVKHWFDLTRLTTDAMQKYELYLWSYSQLILGIKAEPDGTLIRAIDNGTKYSDFIRVNGYLSFFVSNGINLIEYLRSIAKHESKSGFRLLEQFEERRKNENEQNFVYRLGYLLRIYSQHGQMVVSMWNNGEDPPRIHLDLHQLSEPIFEAVNAKSLKKIKELTNELFDFSDDGMVHFSYLAFVHAFHKSVCSLYCYFLDLWDPYISKCRKTLKETFDLHDELRIRKEDNISFWIILEESEKGPTAHIMFDEFEQNSKGMLEEIAKASNELKNATKLYDTFIKNFKPISS